MTGISLKILLPNKVFADLKDVAQLKIDTTQGSLGILPRRLDCVAVVIPGILTYESSDSNVEYIAVNEGIMVKNGNQVLVSVRNAIAGTSLGNLKESVEKEFKTMDESESSGRSSMAKLESGFMLSFDKFRKE